MSHDDIGEEIESEMRGMLHGDERRTKSLDSETLRAPLSEIRLRKLVRVAPGDTVADAVASMVDNRQGCVLVIENDKLLGIFTERDVLSRVAARDLDPTETRVRDVMSADPETLTPDAMIAYALNLMHVNGYRHVPVVDALGTPQGVLSVRDVLAYLADFFPEEVLTLPPNPGGTLPLHGG